MLIPMRCFTCGCLLANKHEYYRKRVEELGGDGNPVYFDGSKIPQTPEKQAMDEMGITRLCCKKTLLTSVDLTDKL